MTEPRASAARAAVAGAVSAGAAIAVAELLAGLVSGAPSLILAVGDLLISLQPPGAKELVVGLFGTDDKLAVNAAVLAGALAVGALLGVLARRRWWPAVAGFGLVGALVGSAALREPLVTPLLAVLGPALGVVVAVRILRALLDLAAVRGVPGVPGVPGAPAAAVPVDTAGAAASTVDRGRRGFLLAAGGIAVASIVGGVIGRRLLDAASGAAPLAGSGSGDAGSGSSGSGAVSGSGSGGASLPAPEVTAPPLPPAAQLDVAGITPLVVPNDDFYRIDTALSIPRVDASTWMLTVRGMVAGEIQLSYRDLLALPNFEQYVTIACVSNEVGGHLVGNAKWQGVHLRDVLAMAGVQPGATQIVGRSVDDFTVGFPTAWAMDPARDPMIATGMNGEPLPVRHGFPARLIVPGLYGYVSATKWLKEIELTTLEAFDAYSVPLGWAKEAPILTQSRIDVPRAGQRFPVGRVSIGGVAWAPDRGVSAVEVRIGGGAWQPATMSAAVAKAAWIQWRYDWDATAAGTVDVTVRATDGTGAVQDERVTPPAPDGARGYHRVSVEIV